MAETIHELAKRSKRDLVCHVDTDTGVDDELADGTEAKPYKSLGYAYIQRYGSEGVNFQTRASVTGTEESRLEWKEPSKSSSKKAQTILEAHQKKLTKRLAKQQDDLAAEEEAKKKRLEALGLARKVVIKEDPSLAAATKITIGNKGTKLGDDSAKGERVKVYGRIHRLSSQKHATFITLVDGHGHLQCIVSDGPLTQTYDALTFAMGTSLLVFGEMKNVPEGHSAPDGRELHVDYYEVIGTSPSGADAMTTKVSASQNHWDTAMLDARHLVLRGDKASSLMRLRDTVEWAFIKTYRDLGFVKVSPPALVQTQVEGGATLFKVPYYDETAFLTQSSQLYLETVIPSLGNVYCIEKSFRAEKSLTRRHLSEYTHVEAELDFITFDALLEHLEEIVCRVIDIALEDPAAAAFLAVANPGFTKPIRPFMRMRYSQAIDWLNAQQPPILNEKEELHVFGDDIAEAAERRMTDIIGKPIMLTHFPVELKAFYMKKDPADPSVTESCDVLMPGVGEIIGGSMRMEGYEELLAAYEREGIPSKEYYWYTDQRKYGTSPHGGYGLGLERFLAWIAAQHTVRTTCLYPRYMTRCRP